MGAKQDSAAVSGGIDAVVDSDDGLQDERSFTLLRTSLCWSARMGRLCTTSAVSC